MQPEQCEVRGVEEIGDWVVVELIERRFECPCGQTGGVSINDSINEIQC
jgi:hypothetical protein